jgi:hypothetical protein
MTQMDDKEWLSQAACLGLDPAIFFSENETYAKSVCANCDVVKECLADVLIYESKVHRRDGVYGGTGPSDRDRMYSRYHQVKDPSNIGGVGDA